MKCWSIFSVMVKSAMTPSFRGADGRDVAGRAAEHVLGLGADGLHRLAAPAGLVADRDDGGLVQHDALSAHVDQRIRRPEVDGQVVGEVAEELLQHEPNSHKKWRHDNARKDPAHPKAELARYSSNEGIFPQQR